MTPTEKLIKAIRDYLATEPTGSHDKWQLETLIKKLESKKR